MKSNKVTEFLSIFSTTGVAINEITHIHLKEGITKC